MRPRAPWLVFDPYLESSGGGERYMFAFARALARAGQPAVMAGPDANVDRLRQFGFPEIETQPMSKLGFIAASRKYEATVSLTNHPPLPSFAKQRFAVVQFPFTQTRRDVVRGPIERWSLSRTRYVVYSEYSRHWLRERWAAESVVVPPPVELGCYRAEKKRRVILNVGRFFSSQHSKRQDALVDAFVALPDHIKDNWRLVLAGGVADGADAQRYVADVKRKAMGLPIDVLTNVDASTLTNLYAEASIYWHATGLGRAASEPEKAEHFGMTTVEAMSFGAVPVVIADGGQPEIVTPESGVLWSDISSLVGETEALIADAERCEALARGAVAAAQRFSVAEFDRRVAGLVTSTR